MPPDDTGSGAFVPCDTGIGNTDDNDDNTSIDTGNGDDKTSPMVTTSMVKGDIVGPVQYQICYKARRAQPPTQSDVRQKD